MIRRIIRSVRFRLAKRFPRPITYNDKVAAELRVFEDNVDVHDLPEIFHYWSNKFLRPKLEPFGITDPEQFFYKYSADLCAAMSPQIVSICSLGSGNCDAELQLATRLISAGHNNFHITCLEINETMLSRGRAEAIKRALTEHVSITHSDLNTWEPSQSVDVYIANQSLHHIVQLEKVFHGVRESLNPTHGWLLTSDMIGRNGHQRWPEALKVLKPFWDELPKSYKINRLMNNRLERKFINHDCSHHGFEGVRAQDILPLLVQNFNFGLFIPFANVVNVFIDRPFGHNFDVKNAFDTDFIDRVHQADESGFATGTLKPTQMIAALTLAQVSTQLVEPNQTPEYCLRLPN